MKNNSNFSFIDNLILWGNLDITFDHIIELIYLLEKPTKKDEYSIVKISSFRKTIIIYTASIIEVFLLWKLKKIIKSDKIKLGEGWKYKDIKKIHTLKNDPIEEIIWCKRKKYTEEKKFKKLNLIEINRLCEKYKIIKNDIFKEVEKVRMLRNRLHISGLRELEHYTKNDLEFVFSVAKKIKSIASK